MTNNEFTEEIHFEDTKPRAIAWLTAISCTLLIFICVISADSFATATHFAVIQNRLLNILSTSNRPELLLDDDYIKSLPEKRLNKVQKIIGIYQTIQNGDFERAKIMVEDHTFTLTSEIFQLRATLNNLSQIEKNKKIESKRAELPEEETQIKMKKKALEVTMSLLKKECLPKINALSELAYQKIKDKI